MKTIGSAAVLALLALAPLLCGFQDTQASGTNLGSVTGGDFKAAHEVIQRRCTACHTSKVIEAAIAANKDMIGIQKAMEQKGAGLNPKERDVLGIYWKTPLKKR